MSTELYIQGYSDRQPYSDKGNDGLPVSEVLGLFRVDAPPDDYGFYPLKYDQLNFCELSLHEAGARAVAVVVMGPCAHEQFWRDVFNLLERGPYVAYMPDCVAPACVRPDVIDHMPTDMIDSMGPPRLVRSPQALRDLMFGE